MNRLSICLLLTTLLLSVLPTVQAAQPATTAGNGSQSWYDIELIVFSYTDPDAGNLESWPTNPGRPDWKEATPLVTPSPSPTSAKQPGALTALEKINGHQLDGDWRRLEKASGYQPLLHVAWEEPLADHSTAPTIQIGVAPPPAPTEAALASSMAPPAIAAGGAPEQTSSGTAPTGGTATTTATPVYGTVKFSQYGPYLHFDVDLDYQGPLAKNVMRVPAPASTASPIPASMSVPLPVPAMATQNPPPTTQWYRMKQDRRIEAGRLNYFDNPMFGVLVLVTPHPVTTTPLKK